MICERTDLQAEATSSGAWLNFGGVVLAVPVPCHLKGLLGTEGGAETAPDAEFMIDNFCNYVFFTRPIS